MTETSRGRVLVAGANGTLGRHLIREFKQRGWWVRALCRSAAQPPEGADDLHTGDVRNPASLAGACAGIDAVFSAVGASLSMAPALWSPDFHEIDYLGNRNLLDAAGAAGVRRFGYASVFRTPALDDLAYVKAHVAFEQVLQDSDLTYSIVQPTGYFSAFDVITRIVRFGIAPLIGDGAARTNPIHEADLAAVCADALEAGKAIVPAGGPDIFTRQEVFDIAFAMAKKPPRYVRLPRYAMAFNRWMILPFDDRLSQLLAFFERVSATDIVAPPYGTRRLRDYIKAEIREAASSL